jgi:hypothetical protein
MENTILLLSKFRFVHHKLKYTDKTVFMNSNTTAAKGRHFTQLTTNEYLNDATQTEEYIAVCVSTELMVA